MTGWSISADSHVIEPPDLWTERLGRRWGERAPRVARGEDGHDWWWVDGHPTSSVAAGTQAGRRFRDPDALVLADRYDNVPAEAREPDAYVRANLDDGVAGSVLFPTQHLVHYKVRDRALLSACGRAYNDWLSEFCQGHPARLRGVAALNVDVVDEAVREVERAAAAGLAAGLVPVALPRGESYADPAFDPLWAAAAANRLPLCLHIGTERADWRRGGAPIPAGTRTGSHAPVQSLFATADLWVRRSLADLIFGGVLERHPGLRVGSVEHEAGWAPHFVDRLDYTYTQRATKGRRFAEGALPSDFFRRQVFVTFSEDALAVREREALGASTLAWSSDFPHSEGTYPRSREIVSRLTAGLGPAERFALTAGTAAELFGFDLAALEPSPR